jgi:hypothetical protein
MSLCCQNSGCDDLVSGYVDDNRLWHQAMKTTLDLDDELLRTAKREAADRGVTLTQVIEEALQVALLPRSREAPFRLRWKPVRGRRPPAVDVADRVAMYDRMEDPP